MARKSNWYVRSKFSHRDHKKLDLKFTFWQLFSMTHIYDVINLWYKKGIQKFRKMSPAETLSPFEILTLTIVYLLKYREPYFFLFFQNVKGRSGNCPYDLKRAKCLPWLSMHFFLYFFALHKLDKNLTNLISFFFGFRVTWPQNRVRKNLPIDFRNLDF